MQCIASRAAGANMPCTGEAVRHFAASGVTVVPSKVANAGGVAVSALEMLQHRVGMHYSREEVWAWLQEIMRRIYTSCKAAAEEYGVGLADGANIVGFLKVAEAMVAQGAV
jgi:glutamate dehydrogenase (NADP+)